MWEKVLSSTGCLNKEKAIVDDVSGVTRDRQYGMADWNGKSLNDRSIPAVL